MRTKQITIHNSFHNTSMVIRIPKDSNLQDHLNNLEYIVHDPYDYSQKTLRNSKNKLKRIKNTLCGSKDCKCSPFIQAEV